MNSRRRFLTSMGLAVGGIAALPRPARAKKLAVRLDQAKALTQVGGSTVLKVKEHTILFVRDSQTTVRAIDPICSHRKCTVAYVPKDKVLKCPCHASAYDLSGKVLKGPAPRPLTTYRAELSGDRIIVSLD